METTRLAINFILNITFISIPQTTLMMILILFLLKEWDYFKKERFKKTVLDALVFGSLGSCLIMNGIYYYGNFNLLFRLSLNVIIFSLFIIYILKINLNDELKSIYSEEIQTTNNKVFKRESDKYVFIARIDKIDNIKTGLVNYNVIIKNKKEILICSTIIMAIVYVIEVFTNLYLDYMFNFDITEISFNILDSMMLVYPGMILYTFAIYLCYLYVNIGGITLFKIWMGNKNFRVVTYIQGCTTFIFTIIIYYVYNKTNLFNSFDTDTIYKIDISLYTMLILHILIPWIIICKKEMSKYKSLKRSKI